MAGSEDSVSTQILNGKTIAADIRKQVAEELATLKSTHQGFEPKLVIVQVSAYSMLISCTLLNLQVGNRDDSNVYIRMKTKASSEVGVAFQHLKLPASTTESELLATLNSLNEDDSVHAILLQLPLESVHNIGKY